MRRKLIIDGNAVYEIDEECMVQQCILRNEDSNSNIEREKQENKKEK